MPRLKTVRWEAINRIMLVRAVRVEKWATSLRSKCIQVEIPQTTRLAQANTRAVVHSLSTPTAEALQREHRKTQRQARFHFMEPQVRRVSQAAMQAGTIVSSTQPKSRTL